jgi:PAS domain S-box-containing protein
MSLSESEIAAEIERVSGLHVNETRLRLALNTANMGTWERNLITGQDIWSPQEEALFGLTPGSFTTTHRAFLKLVHPDDRKGLEDAARLAIEGKTAYRSEFRIVFPDGRVRWMSGAGDVLRDASGRPTHMVGVTMDITERKLAEQRLIAQESRFRALIEKSFDAVAIVAADGIVQYITPSVTRLLGYAPEEFIGQDIFSLIHPADRERVQVLFGRLASHPGTSSRTEYRYRHKNGSYVWIERVASNLLADPDVRGVVINFRDISERKRVEDERLRLLAAEKAARKAAEDADQTKDSFLATVSHELRTPLTAILGWAQLLRTGKCTAEEIERGLKTVERNARSMTQLVEDVLDVSRIITGKLRLRSEPVDLVMIIDAAIDAVRPAAQARNVQMVRTVGRGSPMVRGDAGRLQQVVWNLLSNSVKFTAEGGYVQVDLEILGPRARITVSDNGEGITPEFLPRLFERFTQADNSSRRPHSGLGLGLAIVHQLVELQGGTVRAQSAGPGQGSQFFVELPLIEDALPTDRSGTIAGFRFTAVKENLNGIQVLVVDDEPDTRDFVRKLLTDCGAEVATAGSVAEAMAALERATPTVLLSDIAMSGEDGYDLIRKLRASEKTFGKRPIPAAAVTAFARPEDRDKALAAGFQVHIAKPFDPTELVAVVAKLAGHLVAS